MSQKSKLAKSLACSRRLNVPHEAPNDLSQRILRKFLVWPSPKNSIRQIQWFKRFWVKCYHVFMLCRSKIGLPKWYVFYSVLSRTSLVTRLIAPSCHRYLYYWCLGIRVFIVFVHKHLCTLYSVFIFVLLMFNVQKTKYRLDILMFHWIIARFLIY